MLTSLECTLLLYTMQGYRLTFRQILLSSVYEIDFDELSFIYEGITLLNIFRQHFNSY